MSIRAYKVITKEVEDKHTFNITKDSMVNDYLPYYLDSLDDELGGEINFDIHQLREALETFMVEYETREKENKKEAEHTKRILKKMIKQAKADGGDVVYDCY